MKSLKISAVLVVGLAVAAAGVGFHAMLRERGKAAADWADFSSMESRPAVPAEPKRLVAALLMYTQDYDEKLPPPGNSRAVEPYLPLGEVGNAVGYGVPAKLAGAELPSTPGTLPFIFWEESGGWFAGDTDGRIRSVEHELPELVFYE